MKNHSTPAVNQTGFTARDLKQAFKVLSGELSPEESGLNPIQLELLLKR
jgi:hypothetical protein